jgi:serine/threonine protein kinase
VVLWEMLTGKRLFHAETTPLTLADVLRKELDFMQVTENTPSPVRELLKRCLDRDVKSRLQAIGEARVAIQRYLANPVSETEVPLQAPAAPSPSRLGWLRPGVAVLFALAASALAFVHFRETPPEERSVRFQIAPPDKSILQFFRLPGTEGAASPFWSPDSQFIGFFTKSKFEEDSRGRWTRPDSLRCP